MQQVTMRVGTAWSVIRDRRLRGVLLRVKGTDVTAADVHDAWTAWMQEQDPNHDALRPYGDLPPDVQAEDAPFLEAIKAAAKRS